jgi:hypothetical protein
MAEGDHLRAGRTVAGMDETSEPAGAPPPRMSRANGLGFLIAGVAMALCCGGIALNSAGSRPPDRSGPAVTACENYVKNRLKAPATAKFSDERWGQDGDTFTITGAVDAQNSFGALLRSRFTCRVHDGGGDTWTVQSLTGLD